MTDRWLQRLRDGIAPRPWTVYVLALVLVLAAPSLIVAELHSPAFVAEMNHSSNVGGVVLLELFVVVLGFAMSIGTWWSGRRDRRTLGRIRASGHAPAFFLPVLTKGIRTSEDLPRPRPEVWTFDAAGLHGWTPDHDAPVMDLPWERIRKIDLATKDSRGSRIDYALWFGLAGGSTLVLPPRTTLGRPFQAGPSRLEALLPVMRALRRELGPGLPRPGRTTTGS